MSRSLRAEARVGGGSAWAFVSLLFASLLVLTQGTYSAATASSQGPVDWSGISREERQQIERACAGKQTLYGPAAAYACHAERITELRRSGGPPEWSGVSREERQRIERTCAGKQALYGPAAAYACHAEKISELRRSSGPPEWTGVSREERQQIERTCAGKQALYGPAAAYACQAEKVTELTRIRRPDAAPAEEPVPNREPKPARVAPAQRVATEISGLRRPVGTSNAQRVSTEITSLPTPPASPEASDNPAVLTPNTSDVLNPPLTSGGGRQRGSPEIPSSARTQNAIQSDESARVQSLPLQNYSAPASSSSTTLPLGSLPPKQPNSTFPFGGLLLLAFIGWLVAQARGSFRQSPCSVCGTPSLRQPCSSCAAETARRKAEEDARAQEQRRREAEAAWARRFKYRADLDRMTGSEFERLIATKFREVGYEVLPCGGSGDDGIDLVMNHCGHKDVVQCKRWKNDIGSPIVRDFYGALLHANARHGFIVTTARVSASAARFAGGKPITFIDGDTLLAWLDGTYRPEPPRRPHQTSSDPYAVLGLQRPASAETVRQAYRDLASKYHPDKVQHLGREFQQMAEQRLKEINAAYQQIRNEAEA